MQYEFLAVGHEVVVDALQTACLQLAGVASEGAGALGYHVVGGIFALQVHGYVVGVPEREVALYLYTAAYRPCAFRIAYEACRHLYIDTSGQRHALLRLNDPFGLLAIAWH